MGGSSGGGGGMIGGVANMWGAHKAASVEDAAARRAAESVTAAGAAASEKLDPYATQGSTAIGEIGKEMPYMTHQFGAQDLKSGLAPNYEWQLAQGEREKANALNATQGAGGNFAKGLEDYTQNFAANAYQQAFQNYQGQRQNIFSNLYQIAGLGEKAATRQGEFGTGAATQAADYRTSGAAARAAGYMGEAKGIGQIGQGAQQSAFLGA